MRPKQEIYADLQIESIAFSEASKKAVRDNHNNLEFNNTEDASLERVNVLLDELSALSVVGAVV